MYTQLQRVCRSAAKGVQPGSEAAIELTTQSNQLAARRQRWPVLTLGEADIYWLASTTGIQLIAKKHS